MEPLDTVENYMIMLAYDDGMISHYKKRLEVGDFINGIDWTKVKRFAVEPVEPLAKWELELLGCVAEEEAAKLDDIANIPVNRSELMGTFKDLEEWKVIEALPIRSFEINRHGDIRHRASKRLMEQEFDIDQCRYRTILKINGVEFTIDSRRMADELWTEATRAS